MLPEIADYALPLDLAAAGLLLALLLQGLGQRTPLPSPVLLLIAGSATATLIPGVDEHVSILTVERIAVVALIVILLSGGLDIGARNLRGSLREVTALGIGGTFLTAAMTAVAAHYLLGFDWKVAGVIGAALAPTDPAVTFSVLGGREITGRSDTVLEGEAGVNDPAGIALLLGMLEVATHEGTSVLVILQEFLIEMGIGAALGIIGGLGLAWLLKRVRLPSGGEHAVLVIVSAVALYSVTAILTGSGFFAVFVAGLLISDVTIPHRVDIERFVGGLASLAELTVFLVLGLTIDLAAIDGRDWIGGVVLALAVTLIARPVVTAVALWRSSLTGNERAFVAIAGMKGAVPILLAAFAVLASAPQATRVYDLVFVVVLVSVAAQGSLLPVMARRLNIGMTERPRRPWELNLQLVNEPGEYEQLTVLPDSEADGLKLSDLSLPPEAWPTLILREDHAVAAHPDLVLVAFDVLQVATGPGSAALAPRLR